jgi:hypothetical protein
MDNVDVAAAIYAGTVYSAVFVVAAGDACPKTLYVIAICFLFTQ